MKKFILIAVIALTALVGFSAEVYVDIDLTPTGTGTNTATYTVTRDVVVYPMAVYQNVTDTTNTVVITIVPAGETGAYTADTLSAVNNTVALETIGIGDVTADVDPIWLTKGDVLTLTGTGTDAADVEYVLRTKQVTQ